MPRPGVSFDKKCPAPGCLKWCKGYSGLKQHIERSHKQPSSTAANVPLITGAYGGWPWLNNDLDPQGSILPPPLWSHVPMNATHSPGSTSPDTPPSSLQPTAVPVQPPAPAEHHVTETQPTDPVAALSMIYPISDSQSIHQSYSLSLIPDHWMDVDMPLAGETDPFVDEVLPSWDNVPGYIHRGPSPMELQDTTPSEATDSVPAPDPGVIPTLSSPTMSQLFPETEDDLFFSDANLPSARLPSLPNSSPLSHRDPVIEEHDASRCVIKRHPCLTGDICEPDSSLVDDKELRDWFPFANRLEFEMADFLYRRVQMSAGNIDTLMEIWGDSLAANGNHAPFTNCADMYRRIDAIPYGKAEWESIKFAYVPEDDDVTQLPWMEEPQVVWFRNPLKVLRSMIASPAFDGEFDYVPYHKYVDGIHHFQDFMSGDWAWKQANEISADRKTHGAFFVPIILGSDKTTVSVATGNNEYWPVYMSIGNLHNSTRRAHRNGLVVIAFLSIPKADREYRDKADFRRFRRQLLHTSLGHIFRPAYNAMKTPICVKCPDGNYRRAIFGFGPYIGDYPEQCMLACVVQTWCPKCLTEPRKFDDTSLPITPRSKLHTSQLAEDEELVDAWDEYGLIGDVIPFTQDFPCADIHELISPDILHQVIKGTFKDHLVTWVDQYIMLHNRSREAKQIMDSINQRMRIVPLFPKLRRFPQGRDFKQWTGNDSKALMKVYLPALKGYVPSDILRTIRAFLEFCYIVRQDSHSALSLFQLDDALQRFHQYRQVFVREGVRRPHSVPPCQHSLVHYGYAIRAFGSPNGLCSSITESKHIDAVKKPWRRSNRYEALGQMLTTNNRNDQLQAARSEFEKLGLYRGDIVPSWSLKAGVHQARISEDEEAFDGPLAPPLTQLGVTISERNINLNTLTSRLRIPRLPNLVAAYLKEFANLNSAVDGSQLLDLQLALHTSAVSMFYALSDHSGLKGMRCERIRTSNSWGKSQRGRYDTVFIRMDPSMATFSDGLTVARVRQFFSFSFEFRRHSCALVEHFKVVGDDIDETMGMWIVRRDRGRSGTKMSIVPVQTILRAVHLIPVYDMGTIPHSFSHLATLDHYQRFYVNRFVDYHAFEVAI